MFVWKRRYNRAYCLSWVMTSLLSACGGADDWRVATVGDLDGGGAFERRPESGGRARNRIVLFEIDTPK